MLLRNDTDAEGEKTYQLADNVKNYNFLIVAYGDVYEDKRAAGVTQVIYSANVEKPFTRNDGSGGFNGSTIKIEGDKWIGIGFDPDPPRLIVGLNLKL